MTSYSVAILMSWYNMYILHEKSTTFVSQFLPTVLSWDDGENNKWILTKWSRSGNSLSLLVAVSTSIKFSSRVTSWTLSSGSFSFMYSYFATFPLFRVTCWKQINSLYRFAPGLYGLVKRTKPVIVRCNTLSQVLHKSQIWITVLKRFGPIAFITHQS